MRTAATRMLLRDELLGFAKSKVMIVLWVLLPLLATLGYFLLPLPTTSGGGDFELSLTDMMGALVSSLAGTIAAVMVAVDVVGEKTRRVYDLLVIRPIPRSAILHAKFFAVFISVTVACAVSLCVGITTDLIRGVPLPPGAFLSILKSLGSVIGVIAISTAVGILFGVFGESVLVAVVLVLYGGQNLAVIPMIPAYFQLGDRWYWILLGLSAAVTVAVMYLAGFLFRRHEF